MSFVSPKTLLHRLGLRPKKTLGQHFLLHPHQARRIVAALNLTGEETVVEIGAGLGALTGFLAPAARRVVALERDPALARFLREELSGRDPRGRGPLPGRAGVRLSRGRPGGGPAPGGGGKPALPDHLAAAVQIDGGEAAACPGPCS